MSIRVEVVCIAGDGSEQRREILAIERRELAMETLGLTLAEGKALLAGVQDFVVQQQVQQALLSNGGLVPIAGSGTPAKTLDTRPWQPCSGRSRCPIHAGTAAHAKRMARRHFVP